MLQTILLVLILILQAVFSGLIYANTEGSFDWSAFFSFLQVVAIVVGFFIAYDKLKKEILFKKKLEVHERITNILVDGLHKSFYDLSPFINNSYNLEKSNPKEQDDYSTKTLGENSKHLIQKISSLQSNFQIFSEFFMFWKALFSEKVDKESKFLFDLADIFMEDLWNYHRKLNDYAMLSLMKDEADIEKEKENLLSLEKQISKKSNVFANGLDKLVSDMSREVFSGLFLKNKNTESRLFDPEIENSNDGDPRIFLTDKGFKYQLYKRTDFQKEFGGFKKRRKVLRKFLEQK